MTPKSRKTAVLARSNAPSFARKSGDKTPRPLRFVPALRRTLVTILPDQPRVAALEVPVKADQWRTMRLRPEIVLAIEVVAEHHARQTGGKELTTSEALAAALLVALSVLLNEKGSKV